MNGNRDGRRSMQTCPLLRTSPRNGSRNNAAQRRAPTRVKARARRWLAISATLSEWTGWRALHDLLSAIPDSNDDFSLF
ncbi:hypothetical protein [Paraburkholderia ribeironis]|uniref:hypothetical protein n=1 Tax=Paraburkholderia ribeironis TaxID=1247936 RepID=UPI001178AB0E|nr:hypothetical protein [Paraburkholderia ribeironis]